MPPITHDFIHCGRSCSCLIYLKKHKITEEENSFKLTVGAEPVKAGIDPINKLIDRNPKDNVKSVTEKEEEAI